MTPSNARSFLLAMLVARRAKGVDLSHWEFSLLDEARLFDFIHPSVNTRGGSFTLFNLPVKWDAARSALAGDEGVRFPFELAPCFEIPEGANAELRVRFLRTGASPEAAAKAAEISVRGEQVR